MARRKMQKGICRLCKKNTDLSFEHIPPKVAFNKYTKFRSVPFLEYAQNAHKTDYQPNAKLQQGGLGKYCLCRKCNSFLGNNYVPDYFKMSQTAKAIFQNKDFSKAFFTTREISPLRFLKQILSMFVCINDPDFTDDEPELLNFLKNPSENNLSDKFRIFMYLNHLGQIRSLTSMYTNKYGLVNELTFPPLGFVLSINSDNSFPLTEITHFKNISIDYTDEVTYELFNLPTHLPFPVDYRTREEIDEAVRKSEKYQEE
ncbi:hypothetical protein [Flavobacterium sp. FlaQc-50]|jgi:hypothetical protein|uniref:hypothetical protein n=1 Tax=unclassified Flavobacterium TaxID=196869 RepID=UPI0037567151